MSKLGPTPEEIEAMRSRAPDGPVTIVNLLRMQPGDDGRAAYGRYLRDARSSAHPDVEVLHAGPVFHDFGAGDDWDYVIIARYQRFDDFAATVGSDAWQHAARHRTAALQATLMIVSPVGDLPTDFER